MRALADWLVEREVEEVVMESTAQYWRPVWEALEHGRSSTKAFGTRNAPAVSEEAKKVRARKMIRELRSLGYRVELAPTPIA